MIRLAVARLWFCSNSFAPARTGLEELTAHEWTDAPEALLSPEPGDALDGVARFLATRRQWEATMLRAASAPTGGPLTEAAFGSWLGEIEYRLLRGSFDALYLSLHGACQAEGEPQADLTIIRRLRLVMGRKPIVASFDMHANLTEESVLLLDGFSANRVWPHGGADAAAIRALKLLDGIVTDRRRPIGFLATIPPDDPGPVGPAADDGAMPGPVLDASVYWGFPWADVPAGQSCVVVWADRDRAVAREMACRLAHRAFKWWPRAPARPVSPTAALLAALGATHSRFAILDMADDPLAGGLLDTPELVRAVLAADPPACVVGPIHDPALIAEARRLGVVATLRTTLCARVTRLFGAPVPIEAEILRIVEPTGADEAGGTLVVLRVKRVLLLICGKRPFAVGPSLFARAGLALEHVRVLALKSGEASRGAFAPLFDAVIACDCPGPASMSTGRLPFRFGRPSVLPERLDALAASVDEPAIERLAPVPAAMRV